MRDRAYLFVQVLSLKTVNTVVSMKFFFDFDDFFFDTENGLVPDTFRRYEELTGASQEAIRETYQLFSKAKAEHGTLYTFEQHLRFLQEHADFDFEKACRELEVFFSDLRKYVYDGAQEFLESLHKDDVFLLTYGDDRFQKTKVRGSGLEKHFSQVFVTQGDKVEAIIRLRKQLGISDAEAVVFGDNRCEYFDGAKEVGLVTIHMKRPEDSASKNPCGECQYRVGNFQEMKECIVAFHSQASAEYPLRINK